MDSTNPYYPRSQIGGAASVDNDDTASKMDEEESNKSDDPILSDVDDVEEEGDDDDTSVVSESDDESDDDSAWFTMIERAMESLKEEGETFESADELILDPKFSMLIEALRKEVTEVVATYQGLVKTPIHKAMKTTKEQNLMDGMDNAEASEAAWDRRKQLIKLFLKDNMYEIRKIWEKMQGASWRRTQRTEWEVSRQGDDDES